MRSRIGKGPVFVRLMTLVSGCGGLAADFMERIVSHLLGAFGERAVFVLSYRTRLGKDIR